MRIFFWSNGLFECDDVSGSPGVVQVIALDETAAREMLRRAVEAPLESFDMQEMLQHASPETVAALGIAGMHTLEDRAIEYRE